jgi:hypothetical protein
MLYNESIYKAAFVTPRDQPGVTLHRREKRNEPCRQAHPRLRWPRLHRLLAPLQDQLTLTRGNGACQVLLPSHGGTFTLPDDHYYSGGMHMTPSTRCCSMRRTASTLLIGWRRRRSERRVPGRPLFVRPRRVSEPGMSVAKSTLMGQGCRLW